MEEHRLEEMTLFGVLLNGYHVKRTLRKSLKNTYKKVLISSKINQQQWATITKATSQFETKWKERGGAVKIRIAAAEQTSFQTFSCSWFEKSYLSYDFIPTISSIFVRIYSTWLRLCIEKLCYLVKSVTSSRWSRLPADNIGGKSSRKPSHSSRRFKKEEKVAVP